MVTGLAIGSLVLSAVGSVTSANQKKQEGEVAAQIGDFNAKVATDNAALARSQALEEEIRVRKGEKTLKGKQRAAFAASGVDVGVGSPLLVLADTAREAELQALTVRQRGEIQATGFEQQAIGQKFKGAQSLQAGKTGAAATILSGAGRTLKTGFTLNQAGAFS